MDHTPINEQLVGVHVRGNKPIIVKNEWFDWDHPVIVGAVDSIDPVFKAKGVAFVASNGDSNIAASSDRPILFDDPEPPFGDE